MKSREVIILHKKVVFSDVKYFSKKYCARLHIWKKSIIFARNFRNRLISGMVRVWILNT